MTLDTITALATPPGYGGIGVIRISGEKTQTIAKAILGKLPQPRQAEYLPFKDQEGAILDIGIALFFPGPNSFTGEDVLELQGHGGPIILDGLLQHILTLGAGLARPGEFSERAFLNDKIDLTQAEAIADLINASSKQAARSAIRSLQGEFSSCINQLLEQLIQLRIYVEAAIDFPEEEINFLNDAHIQEQLTDLINKVGETLQKAQQGAILKEGIHIVITGKPNAGKSTLLNCLSGREAAIVTDIPGTTRDVMREQINIDGMPLHIIDTAGLRDSTDKIEQEGIRRAWGEIEKADRILLMLDSQEKSNLQNEVDFFCKKLPKNLPITIIRNKIDLTQEQSSVTQQNGFDVIALSAKEKQGMDKLLEYLKASVGYQANTEAEFIARRRHLTALTTAQQSLHTGQQQLQQHQAGELLAEDLRTAQQALAEITGEFTSDDLLGRIFSSFCIGK